ncbi:MAG: biopolymer transporter ExbD [Acidobacteriota bacterium]
MASSSTGANKQTAPIINVTPLIDVLLVLLIIFMVNTPLRPYKLETKIPAAPPQDEMLTKDVQIQQLVLTIDQENNITLNSQPISLAELSTRIKDLMDSRPKDQRTLFIKAPRKLTYGYVVKIVDIVKGAGAGPIGLQIDYLDSI